MGDLNTLSPLDADEHASTGLLARLSAEENLARKFLRRGVGGAPEGGKPHGGASIEHDVSTVQGAGGVGSLFGNFFGSAAGNSNGNRQGDSAAAVSTNSAGAAYVQELDALPPWEIDYGPMRLLLDGGFVDAGHATSVGVRAGLAADTVHEDASQPGHERMAAAAIVFSVPNHSVPTLINADSMHAAAMRLDYAMVSVGLSKRCAVRSVLVRDAETEMLSDHYPLLTDMDC